jgi:hypothetical protein
MKNQLAALQLMKMTFTHAWRDFGAFHSILCELIRLKLFNVKTQRKRENVEECHSMQFFRFSFFFNISRR